MDLGPVTYLVVEFMGNQFKGEIAPLLNDMVDRGLIRIMDFVVVRKDHDGSVQAIEFTDLRPGVKELFEGLSATAYGLLGHGDIEALAEALNNDTSAGILVFENVWARDFADAIVRAGGRWVLLESVPADVLEAALVDMP